MTGTLDSLPADERTVLANTYRNLRGESAARLDRTVRAGLDDAGVTSVARALVFKPISVASTVVSLAAVDQVDRRVRLTSGRLPNVCTPARCEVLSVQLPGVATTFEGNDRAERELGIVVTGTAELTDHRLVGVGLIGANDRCSWRGAEQMAGLTSLQLSAARSAGSGHLTDGRSPPPASTSTTGLFARSRTRSTWRVTDRCRYLAADAVAAAEARAAASADRFAVLGAGAERSSSGCAWSWPLGCAGASSWSGSCSSGEAGARPRSPR